MELQLIEGAVFELQEIGIRLVVMECIEGDSPVVQGDVSVGVEGQVEPILLCIEAERSLTLLAGADFAVVEIGELIHVDPQARGADAVDGGEVAEALLQERTRAGTIEDLIESNIGLTGCSPPGTIHAATSMRSGSLSCSST